jgi:hypothetical protein
MITTWFICAMYANGMNCMAFNSAAACDAADRSLDRRIAVSLGCEEIEALAYSAPEYAPLPPTTGD